MVHLGGELRASAVWLAVRPPPLRNGSPKWRAIWPVQSSPMADSGVPKLGEPDCMSVLDRNEPNTTGHPGWTSCVSAMPASASAICCTSVAGIDTGDIAPISRNGVITTAWFARLYSTIALSIRSSQRSGELQLISEIETGESGRPPKRISPIWIVSTAFGPEITEPMYGLSDRVCSAYTMSRWRESSGVSLGSTIVPPGESSSSNDCESFTKFS